MSLVDARIKELNARISELLEFNNQFEERARVAEREMKPLVTPRPESEWSEEMGPVLWWKFPIEEEPYVGGPNDCGKEVLITTEVYTIIMGSTERVRPYQGAPGQRLSVGGWPGYHTHWTPLPKVVAP